MKLGLLVGMSLQLAIKEENKEKFLNMFSEINSIDDLERNINILYSNIQIDEKQKSIKYFLDKTLKKIDNFDKEYFIFGGTIGKDLVYEIFNKTKGKGRILFGL